METKNFILELRTKKEAGKRICQCCGMPIEDDSILGREKDGTLNENYCKWCYADGTYTYGNMEELIEVCVKHMVNENFTEEQAHAYMKELLPKLDCRKKYKELSDNRQFFDIMKISTHTVCTTIYQKEGVHYDQCGNYWSRTNW